MNAPIARLFVVVVVRVRVRRPVRAGLAQLVQHGVVVELVI